MTPADFKDYALAMLGLANTCVLAWGASRVRKLERNTNSIKDALVASTARASHAEGLAEGKREARL